MPPFLNNPLPSSMRSECKKTGRILASFVDPRQAFGPDKIIPPNILANAKGLAILTVFKAGFLGSARFGSGVVVARLADGSWSAPSAIGTVGGGFGGQIGFELTDFVFILNDASAVKTFAQQGSLTLGGNVSIAAGPVGRNAEAAGAASLKSVAGIFAYSKTKGLFAGVSLEGSAIIERSDANSKLYNRKVSARELLGGNIPVPAQAEPLTRVLNSRVFAGIGGSFRADDSIYNDVPIYDDNQDDVVWQNRTGSAYGEGVRTNRTGSLSTTAQTNNANEYEYHDSPQRSSTFDSFNNNNNNYHSFGSSDRKIAPGRPTAPKPFTSKSAEPGQAIAKFTFDADQDGDLGFRKGEIITILKRTENETDWWTGRIGNREGIFPSNYVDLV